MSRSGNADVERLPTQLTETARQLAQFRGLLLWALYLAQGELHPVGQPIRRVLGIGPRDRMTADQIRAASDAAAEAMLPPDRGQE